MDVLYVWDQRPCYWKSNLCNNTFKALDVIVMISIVKTLVSITVGVDVVVTTVIVVIVTGKVVLAGGQEV